MSWQIYVDGLEFYAYHGVSEAEREVGHRYRLRIECLVPHHPSIAEESLKRSVDYSKLAEFAQDYCSLNRFQTLEALVYRLAESLFRQFKSIEELEITLEKALPPMPFVCEAAGVQAAFSRGDFADSQGRNRNQ